MLEDPVFKKNKRGEDRRRKQAGERAACQKRVFEVLKRQTGMCQTEQNLHLRKAEKEGVLCLTNMCAFNTLKDDLC